MLTGAPEAERKFDQLQLSLNGALAGLNLQGSVAWTELRGNFFSGSGYDDPSGIDADAYVHPNLQTNSYGRLPNSSEREFKLRGSGTLPWGLRAGAFLAHFSGDAYTPTYRVNRNHAFRLADGQTPHRNLLTSISGQSVFVEERGSRLYPADTNLDLHLDRQLRLRDTRWVVGFDVFNLLNAGTVRTLRTSVNNQDPTNPSSLFGAARLRVPPRTLRLTTSLRF